jgi:hypothetical protein
VCGEIFGASVGFRLYDFAGCNALIASANHDLPDAGARHLEDRPGIERPG